MLTLSSFVSIAKRYAACSSTSNETLINRLLSPYVETTNITARGGNFFYLDKYRTSKIMQGQADVPRALQEARFQHDLERRLSESCASLWGEVLDPSSFNAFAHDILGSIDESNQKEEALKRGLLKRLDKRDEFLACLIIGVLGLKNKSDKEGLLWKSGTGSLSWYAGNLFKFGFGQKKKLKNLVVIPVDCNFTLDITHYYEAGNCRAVSEHTLHGSWIRRMAQSGVIVPTLKMRVERGLRRYTALEDSSYPIGTIVAISNSKCTFLLLAVSKFDSNGNAQSSPQDIQQAISSLLRYYDKKGQGADLYIPLIGTGLSRARISHQESFSFLEQEITEGSNFIGGKVTIVVLPEVAEELGLIEETF